MKENRKRSLLDKVILGVVVAIALVVIALSFSNTALLARELGLNEYLTAGLVEILFASLLFIRGRQRATQRNVPLFLSIGYFVSLMFVTGVNMYGLYQESPTVGPIVGATISGAMWLMESVLVWLWVDSHRPHRKKMKELKREAQKEIEEIKLKQQIEWMRWEAQKPDLSLIRKARKMQEKRVEVVGEGMPEFFRETDQAIIELQSIDQSNTYSSITDQSAINQSSNQDQSIITDQSELNHSINQEEAEPITQDPINQSFIDQPIKIRSNNDQASINHSVDQLKIDQEAASQSIGDQSELDEPINQEQSNQPIDQRDRSTKRKEANQSSNDRSDVNEPIGQKTINQPMKQEANKVIDQSDSDRSIKSNVVSFDEELAARYPIAETINYYQEHGKLPSYRQLMKLAKVSYHKSSVAVKWLKEQIEQGKVA